jgi:hypothetical protein
VSEQTTLCPKCGFPSQGPRIRPHNCAKRQAHPEQYGPQPKKAGRDAGAPSALTVIPPKKPAVIEAELVALGESATEDFGRAVGGMRSLLLFWGKVKLLQQRASGFDSQAENQIPRKRGNVSKPTDMKAVFERYMPKVNLKTGYRFMDIGEQLAGEEYAQIVGERTAKTMPMVLLVTTPAAELQPPLRKKQEQLFEHMDGTSKQSWLDKFRAAKERGGPRETKEKPLSPAEQETKFLEACREDFTTAFTGLDALILNGRWKAPTITDGELEDAVACAEKWIKQARAHLKLPKGKRSRPSLNDAEEQPEEDAQ